MGAVATQSERREKTRRALLDAAAETLVDRGANGFTTAAVATRAGLSNGALFRHFPTRLDLVAATVEHVLTRLRRTYEDRFTAIGAGVTPGQLLALLWECMSDAQLAAVYELYAQCRTDDDLLAAIAPIVAEHADHITVLAVDINSRLGHDDAMHLQLTSLAMMAMQGVVISNLAGTAIGEERDFLPLLAASYEAAGTSPGVPV